jgi:6-phosphofructokinase 1
MNGNQDSIRIGVLTSGGDAPGMNAALRSIVRTASVKGAEPYVIYEGYQGMVDGGNSIRKVGWNFVGGILQKGGTVIGTARSEEFFTRAGRLKAAKNLIRHKIDRLIVIGGDGSLTGAMIFSEEWSSYLKELREIDDITEDIINQHPKIYIVGLVGSIDNDVYGTDMTIGADTALHRITEAVDAISSTAASHQRTFVVKVMGRNCGYLALMGALSTGASWVLIPESPPNIENWEEVMCNQLKAGRKAGRRDSIVILAEGARDRDGNQIGSTYVKDVLEKYLNEEVRVTVLGHVQRGGPPSAFDRNLGTLMGYSAVESILNTNEYKEPQLIGIRGNRITTTPLDYCIEQTKNVREAIDAKDYERAMELRSSSFREAFRTLRTIIRTLPHPPGPTQKRYRLAILNAGTPAPGMNTATRAAVRLGIDQGHIMYGVRNGFQGLIENDIVELKWMDVNGWASMGGSELGTNRKIPEGRDLYLIARNLEEHDIHGLMVIGGWTAYASIHKLYLERSNFPAFNIPIIGLPATINNGLPGSELSLGADTALNNIVEAIDKIKQSAVATRRCFVVEVMGYYCGYLALMAGMATGAERVYLHEEGVALQDLLIDLENLNKGFSEGKRLGLMIRNEYANPVYTTSFMCSLFEEEGGDLYDVRQAILGHLQVGGDPSAFDRIQATRFASKCVEFLIENAEKGLNECASIGLSGGKIQFQSMEDFLRVVDVNFQRSREQWWLNLRPIAKIMAQPGIPKITKKQ